MVEEVGALRDDAVIGLRDPGHRQFPRFLDHLPADLVGTRLEELGGIGAIDRFSAAGYDHPLELLEDLPRSTHMTPDIPNDGTAPEIGAGSPSTVARPAAASRPELGDDCWFLAGPTAAGKTSLGIRMAEHLGAEIISVDSMAVYRGLDIGTAKPGPAERSRVPHHLLDVVAPSEAYNVARWLADVGAAIAGIRARGHRILFVGGTPLYLRALRDGLADVPGEMPEIRERLRAEIEAVGPAVLHHRLTAVDPEAARRIHQNDARRIVRALEVAASGMPLSAAFAPSPHPVFSRQMMVLDLPRDLLRDRIDRRVVQMFAAGLVDETRWAAAEPGGIGATASQAAGYSEALAVLAGNLPLSDAIRLTQARTRQLAKRQLTWLRSFSGAVWLAA